LEVIAAGCIPITTRASGIDDRLLEQCVVVEPGQPEQHRNEIAKMLEWSETEYRDRQVVLSECLERRHTWAGFDERVRKVVWNDD
ncbi:MAG: hypothetical protein WA580_07435, partial [Acidimicrobiales bacterium]